MTEGPERLVATTIRALVAPRRLIPIVLVITPMILAQHSLSTDPLAAPLGIVMAIVFMAVGPTAWRALSPSDDRPLGAALLRGIAYIGLGVGAVGLVGIVLPRLAGMGETFLTTDSSLVIDLALFLVGGWGLGRDIEFEARLDQAKQRTAALEREAERAHLLALRSHLDPHFLFNTLNAVAEWCRKDGEVAERAILQLSSMLRAVMEGIRAPAWPLARELELLDALFALYLIRDPKMFTLERSIAADVPGILVPPMILLPLAENAMKHGPAKGAPGIVRLAAVVAGETLRVRLENPGGFAGRREGGVGIATVEQRLALAYDGAAAFAIRGAGEATVAELTLPRRGPRE